MAKRKTYHDLVAEIAPKIKEVFPWDVEQLMKEDENLLILDVRELHEYDTMHIKDSLQISRGILETAVEWDHEETEPELVEARDRQIIVVCRSGSRSVFATYRLQEMGFNNVASLKTGLKGWTEADLPLYDLMGEEVDVNIADRYFANKLLAYQKRPATDGSTHEDSAPSFKTIDN